MTRRKTGDYLLPTWWVLVKKLLTPVLDVPAGQSGEGELRSSRSVLE